MHFVYPKNTFLLTLNSSINVKWHCVNFSPIFAIISKKLKSPPDRRCKLSFIYKICMYTIKIVFYKYEGKRFSGLGFKTSKFPKSPQISVTRTQQINSPFQKFSENFHIFRKIFRKGLSPTLAHLIRNQILKFFLSWETRNILVKVVYFC